MKAIGFFWIVLGLFIGGCNQEEEKPLPEYMIERFSPGVPCDTINYMYLEFPDSAVNIADTMLNVRLFDGWGDNVISAGLLDTSRDISYGIHFYDRKKISKKYEFIEIGSYKFYGRPNHLNPDGLDIGVEFIFLRNGIGSISRAESNYFHVRNKTGNNFQMTLCGEFDVLIGNDFRGITRVKGNYNLTFTDYYF